jgi:hypothetical protein
MRKLVGFFLLIALSLWMGCGDDDGTDPTPVPVPRVVVAQPGVAPSLDNADDGVWSSVIAKGIAVSATNVPKVAVGKAAAVPDSVYVKAIVHNDSLYVRLVWDDASHDIWRDRYEVDTIEIGFVRFFHDCCEDNAINREDQLFIMFAGLPDNAYDTWNWRSLTTAVGRLAEGMTYQNGSLEPDSTDLGTAPAIRHTPMQGTSQPQYMRNDSSEFDGYVLYTEYNPPYELVSLDAGSEGWEKGQIIPGWLIDTSVFNRSSIIRGSRWDIRSASKYDSSATEYTVMLCRPLDTGFSDDLNMLALDSVKAKIGVLDNQIAVGTGGTRRGFSGDLWFIL